MQITTNRFVCRVLAAALVLIAVVGCAGDDDERRAGALGENEAEALAWRGEWRPEAEYQVGQVVTYENGTFVAVDSTTDPPDAKCEERCAWTVMAADATPIITSEAIPPPKIQVFEYTTGYDGPVELPTLEFVNAMTLGADLQRWQQAVNDWLTNVAPWLIRHRDDNGTVVGEKLLELGGSYLVFARGVFASAPGLGKTPTPQGSTPTLGSVISGTMVNGGILGSVGKAIPGVLREKQLKALTGPGGSDYSLSCTLSANREPLDDASMALTPKGTSSVSLMGFVTVPADVRFAVGCAHNGLAAGPFVRDLRLVAVKLD